jgi:hypothetical protein
MEGEKETRSNRMLHVLETLLVPILLGVLAFSTNRAGNKIANSQYALASEQQKWNEQVTAREERRKGVELDARLVDLFGQYYFADDQKKKDFAVKILSKMNSADLQRDLALAIQEDKKISDTSQKELDEIVATTASDWSETRPTSAWCYQEDRQTPGPAQFLVACHYSKSRCETARGPNPKTRQTKCVQVSGIDRSGWNPSPKGYMNSWFQYSDKPFPAPFPQLN